MAQYYIIKDQDNVITMVVPVKGSFIAELQELGTVDILESDEFPAVSNCIHIGGVETDGVFTELDVVPPPGIDENVKSNGAQWVEDLSDAEALEQFETTRASALLNSDWTQLQNGPLSAGEVTEAADWRQTLRDITDTTSDPQDMLQILRSYINSRPDFIKIV